MGGIKEVEGNSDGGRERRMDGKEKEERGGKNNTMV